MPMAVTPMSLTSEITDGNFVPQYPNSLPQPPLTNVQLVEQQGVKLHFVEDEAVGPPISEANASYVEDCCKKRILSSELAKFKEAFKRPENGPALSVPTINPNLWAQLPKESKEHDKRLQNPQSLPAKGLTGVVQIKETLLHFNSHPDQFSLLFPKLFAELDSCVALLGNAFLESSYHRRDLLKPAINPRFHSLCGSKSPVTNFLFGDNILESAKSIQSSQKMTRNFASGRGSFQTNRSTNRFSTLGSRTTSSNGNLSFRGQTHQENATEVTGTQVITTTKFFLENWNNLTSNKFLLNVVSGIRLQFISPPNQLYIPKAIHFCENEKINIDKEIQGLLKKGAIQRVDPIPNQFVSNIFTRPKRSGGLRTIIT